MVGTGVWVTPVIVHRLADDLVCAHEHACPLLVCTCTAASTTVAITTVEGATTPGETTTGNGTTTTAATTEATGTSTAGTTTTSETTTEEELTTSAKHDFDAIARGALKDTSYGSYYHFYYFMNDRSSVDSKYLNYKLCEVLGRTNMLTPDTAAGVRMGKSDLDVDAGDQGIV